VRICREKHATSRISIWRLTVSVHVDVNATAGNAAIVCTEEQRQRLIALREKLLSAASPDSAKQ